MWSSAWCRFCCDFDGARFFTCRIHCHFTAKGNQKGASSDIFLIQQVVKFHTSTEHTVLSDETLTRVFKPLEQCATTDETVLLLWSLAIIQNPLGARVPKGVLFSRKQWLSWAQIKLQNSFLTPGLWSVWHQAHKQDTSYVFQKMGFSYYLGIRTCPGWCLFPDSLPNWACFSAAKQTKYIWLIVHWGTNPSDPIQILTEACHLTMISLTWSCKF